MTTYLKPLPSTSFHSYAHIHFLHRTRSLERSAHYPVDETGKPVYVGRVGAEIDEKTAYEAARLCGLNMLRTMQAYIGSLDRVDYFVKALCLVNSAGDFYNMPPVMNGFSDLMVEIFGHRGQHARAAMGAYVLEGNMPVCVDAIVKVRR